MSICAKNFESQGLIQIYLFQYTAQLNQDGTSRRAYK